MAGVGLGKQNLSHRFNEDASTSNFNKKLSKLIKPGIYWGGNVTIIADDQVSIDLFRVVAECSTGELVKVETEEAVVQLVDESTPYLTYNLSWLNDSNNAGIFDTKDVGSLYANDIIFGMCEFTGGIITGIDYSEKTWGLFDENYYIHLGGGIAIYGVLDEDDLGSNSSNHLATQRSINKHIDDHSGLTAGVHGSSSTLVGVDETQTLNNKTLNDIILNGTATGTAISDDETLNGGRHDVLVTEYAVKTYVDSGGVANANQLQGMEPIDEDNMVSNSAIHLPTQQSVKAYVDNSGVYSVVGSIVGTNQIQTLINKTLTDPVINGNLSGTGILDQDDMASNSALQLATQRSIKFYVDNHTGATIAHGVTGNLVGDTDIQTLSNKTLTDPVLNGTLSGTAFLDEDDMASNSAIATSSQQAIKAYVDRYRDIGDIKITQDLITTSATQPWYCLAKASEVLSTTNYPEYVPYLRGILLRYDPLNTNVINFTVNNWAIVTNVVTLTFNATTANDTLLSALVEDQLVHGSYTNWRTITLPLAIGDVPAGDYAITGVNATTRTITFAYTSGDNSGAVSSNVNFYPHRIVGSTTTARHFSVAGRGFIMVGANETTSYIANLRVRDTNKSHQHDLVAGASGTGVFVDTYGTGPSVSGRDMSSGIVSTDPTVLTTLQGGLEAKPKAFVGYPYVFVGTYIA